MSTLKTKSIRDIEGKMEHMDVDTLRHKVLQSAKSFKTSWVDLGQSLYTVWKNKLYKDWGYAKFDTYTSKEIGIRKPTALKLLKSYYFLEREDPRHISKGYSEEASAATMPTYESVDLLRRVHNRKDMDKGDYASIRKNVLENGKDAGAIRKDLTSLIRQREELEPEEVRRKRKVALLRRFLSLLKSVRDEIKISSMAPAQIINDTNKLIAKLETELS